MENVNIAIERYEELIRAEQSIKMIKRLLESKVSSYNYEEFLKFIINEKEVKNAE